MNDSLYFRLVIATVFVGALLAIFDPANRATTIAANQSAQPTAALSSTAQPAPSATSHLPS
jgi:hypothetical protein